MSTPTPSQPTLALDRVLRVLQPLVRLLLRNGVTYTVFAAACKRVFLDAARQELASRGMAETDSAVSLLSGVHRRDVRNLGRDDEERAATAQPAQPEPPRRLGMAAQVVARWMHDRAFLSADGSSRVLPRSAAQGASFDSLVASVSQDVRPKAVLDELLRLGVVQDTPAGLLLARGGFAPRQGFDEVSWLVAQNLQDHAAAAVANLAGEANFLEQAVFVDQITEASAARLQQVSVKAWEAAFQAVMAQAQESFDGDAAAQPADQRRHRARFGVYFYSEREN